MAMMMMVHLAVYLFFYLSIHLSRPLFDREERGIGVFDLMRKGTTGQFLSSRFLCAGHLYDMTYIYIYISNSLSLFTSKQYPLPHLHLISSPSIHPHTSLTSSPPSSPFLSSPCLWHFNWREGRGFGWCVHSEMVLVRMRGWQ